MSASDSLGPQHFFRRANLKDQTQLWQNLMEKKIELCVKAMKNNLIDLKIEKVISVDTAVFKADPAAFFDYLKLYNKETIFANFSNPNGQFFFSATARLNSSSEIELVRTSDLYILQRRESVRLDIPSSLPAVFKIETIDGAEDKTYCDILDISSEGFKIQFQQEPSVPVNIGSVILGDLAFHGHNPFPVRAEVRFTMIPEKEGARRLGGMKIADISAVQKKRFTNFLMYLQEFIHKSKKV